ncbi:MAG: cytochrome b5 domain-containing protein [Candidatus Doudnabacteria bacterium]|nr:cytochrome b5 domain-containing protein [Candidatus Doudnabacteria bacterium]
MKKLIFIALVSLVLVGCTPASSGSTASSTSSTTTSSTGTKTFTLKDIAKSNSRSDCKLAVNGKVYDVTSFINSHPGGTEILQGCGKDATALFTGSDPDGRDHSATAEAQLARFYVGDLVE